jgi:DNA-binding transcriptional LysR family regulator
MPIPVANLQPPPRFQWDDLRILLFVLRFGSYAKAARHTRLSLATVGRRIRALEDAFGLKLVVRHRDGHRLTTAGEALLPAAHRMELAAEEVERAAAGNARTTLRVVGWEWDAMFLSRHLRAISAKLEGIELEIGWDHWPDIDRHGHDLVLSDRAPENPEVHARRLGATAFAAYGTRAYVDAHPSSRTEARWSDCDWVGFNARHRYFATARWLTARRGSEPTYRCPNGFVLVDVVRGGAGLALLPCWLGDSDAALVRVVPPIADLAHETWCVVHADRRRDRRVSGVIAAMARLYAAG